MSPASRFVIYVLGSLLCGACGSADPCVGVADIMETPQGLILTEDEHQAGWGSSQCFTCHQIWRFHVADCTESMDFDMESINEMVDVEDPSSCTVCHGDNGAHWSADTG